MAHVSKNTNLIIKLLQINISEVRSTNSAVGQSHGDIYITPSNSSPEGVDAFMTMLVVGMVVTMSVSIIGVIGNLITIATLIHQFQMPRRKRYVVKMTADTVLILNLSVADLCYSGISLPVMFVIYKNLYHQYHSGNSTENFVPLPDSTCEWGAFIRYTNAITEWTTLGMMAMERCVTIYRFQRKMCPSRFFTPVRTFSYCVIVLLLGMAAQTLTLTKHFGQFGYNYDTLKCDFMPTHNSSFIITPRLFFFTLESAVPCCLILIGYIIILFQVYNSKNFFGRDNSLTSSTQLSMALRRSKTTRLIVMLLTLYLVCVIPVCIYNVVISEDALGKKDNQMIGIALYCLYWIQYSANNFIYVVSNEKYRNAYRQLFCLILCRNVESPGSGLKYTNTISSRPVNQSVSSVTETHRMRLRTPSEMMIECSDDNRRSFKRRSRMRITFVAGRLDLDSLKEVPILIFPTARLNRMYSSLKKKTDLKCNMFSCVNKRKHLSFNDFKRCKRRLSLNVLEKSQSSERKRSLSV